MKISVILPTNRPDGHLYALYSLKEQSMPGEDWELIIVDDYPYREIAHIGEVGLELGIKNMRVLRSKANYWRSNRLIANARNTGLIYAEGELVVFLDDYCWVKPGWLKEHWKTYKRSPYTMLGPMQAVKYVPGVYRDLDRLPPPERDEGYWNEREKLRKYESKEQKARNREVDCVWLRDQRGERDVEDCSAGWFYCCNASAPLDKIILVNGFEEEYDLTSEEDIDLGLRLSKAGCRFWYRTCDDCYVYHMDHREIDKERESGKYKEVTYQELRRRGTIESREDEVQLVLKEKYGTRYDGSWGLHERNRRVPSWVAANIVHGKRIFDLRKERRRHRRA